MEVHYRRCAGLDVHRDSVVACIRTQPTGTAGKASHQVRTFGTMTGELLELSEWLTEHEVSHVVMEATGVYWRPVWRILDGAFDLLLANPQHIKAVPGRKTDVNDATWMAELLAHGLISGSFVPDTPTQDLRMLTRARKQLVRERASYAQRVDKTLQEANIKLSSVLSDLMGLSGRAMLAAIIAGESDPAKLAALAHPQVKASRESLAAALHGKVTATLRLLLELYLGEFDGLTATIVKLDLAIGERLEPYRRAQERLVQIPGIQQVAAAAILSEIGTDMTRFPTAGHLISWATLCPRNDESAGKRRSTRVRRGAVWLKPLLVQCAWGAVRTKGTYLQAQFFRIKARRGPKKAILAVAASMLTAIYHMLKNDTHYVDLGPNHFVKDRARVATQLLRKLDRLGYEVSLTQDREAVQTA
jgi:transposase